MSLICGLLRKDDLCVAGKSKNARLIPLIGDAYTADFHIVLGGNIYSCSHDNIAILSFEFHPLGKEVYITAIRRN
jgi:hypothetical protein